MRAHTLCPALLILTVVLARMRRCGRRLGHVAKGQPVRASPKHGPPAHAATAGVKEAIPPIDLKPSERKHPIVGPSSGCMGVHSHAHAHGAQRFSSAQLPSPACAGAPVAWTHAARGQPVHAAPKHHRWCGRPDPVTGGADVSSPMHRYETENQTRRSMSYVLLVYPY